MDGANGFYQEAMQRAMRLGRQGVRFADVGVSGGVWGLANGYCLMAGASDKDIADIAPLLRLLAPTPETGWLHAGPVGAKTEFDLDLAAVAELWRHSSVVRSWLLDLTADFLKHDQELDAIAPVVADSGEGRWTALEAVNLGVPTPVMTQALMARFTSQGQGDYANKLLAMMRQGFGGHAVKSGEGG